MQELSSKTSLTVAWAPPLVDPDRVRGFQLFQIDYLTQEKQLIYDGSLNPNTL